MRFTSRIVLILFALVLLVSPVADTQPTDASAIGIEAKRPVFGGACKTCPWGAAAEVVRLAMEPLGYDVQICYNCSTGEAPRIVGDARHPPDVERAWQIYPELKPLIPAPPEGPVDFGAVGVKFLWDAYRGVGMYGQDEPRGNLRLLAQIQSPTYLIVAVRKELGISSLSEIKDKRWPVKILGGLGRESAQVLDYYGLTRKAVTDAGGEIVSTFARHGRIDFDVVIGEGTITTAPEFDYWNEISQAADLTYLELPEELLEQLAETNERAQVNIPIGLLKGVDRPIPTVAVSGIAIYTRDDVPDDFAYDVAKALDENQQLFQWSHLNMSYNIHNVWKAYGVPLHPGAEKYYRERHFVK